MPEGRRSKAKQNNAHWSGRQFWVGLVKVRYHVYDLFGRSKSGVLLAEVLIALKLWCFPVHRHFITINSYFRVERFRNDLTVEPLSLWAKQLSRASASFHGAEMKRLNQFHPFKPVSMVTWKSQFPRPRCRTFAAIQTHGTGGKAHQSALRARDATSWTSTSGELSELACAYCHHLSPMSKELAWQVEGDSRTTFASNLTRLAIA